jgi:integrase
MYRNTAPAMQQLMDQLRKWLLRDELSFFGLCFTLRSYARNLPDILPAKISWPRISAGDYTELKYMEKGISISDLRLIFSSALKTARDQLSTIIVSDSLPEGLRIGSLSDDYDNMTVGFSFLSHGRQYNLIRECSMFARLKKRVDLQRYFFVQVPGTTEVSINRESALEFLKRTARFIKTLAVLIHLGSGQPLRGSELLSILYANTAEAPRNLFAIGGQLALLTTYSKTSNMTDGMGRTNIRFLPPCVSDILLAYLAVVRPFECALCDSVFENPVRSRTIYNSKLFACDGKIMTTSQLSRSIMENFANQKIPAIGVHDFRHIATAFAEQLIHFNSYSSDVLSQQRSHSKRTAGSIYATETLPKEVNRDSVKNFQTASYSWQYLLAAVQPPVFCAYDSSCLEAIHLARNNVSKEQFPQNLLLSTDINCSPVNGNGYTMMSNGTHALHTSIAMVHDQCFYFLLYMQSRQSCLLFQKLR